jgi:hypothetical protein
MKRDEEESLLILVSEKVIPIYAKGYFTIARNGKGLFISTFYYYDKEGYYASLDKEKIKEEKEKLKENMQYYLNQETLRINRRRVDEKVSEVEINLLSVNYPMIDFYITFKARLKLGYNLYEDIYENEITEYPFEAIYVFPGKILSAKIRGKVSIKDNIAIVKVKKGMKTGKREIFAFRVI